MSIINLTPHDIVLYDENGSTIIKTYPKSGTVARVISNSQTINEKLTEKYGINIVNAQSFEDINVPSLKDTTDAIIVSMPVGEYIRTNFKTYPMDVLGPDMGPSVAVRDQNGNPIGTRRLCVYLQHSKE